MKKAKIHQSKNQQVYFTLHSKNGKVIATSETYHRKAAALRCLKNNFPAFKVVDKTGK